ncbi:unnamed protein product [Allacma fusca]|uniref:Peptidase M12A domain-containing protein n=1 Tax=Allacma fusca TaxID=39272 RepID=A0A8J2K9W8_9HEXA|nr:unnamed protein product [Allacma fusca]
MSSGFHFHSLHFVVIIAGTNAIPVSIGKNPMLGQHYQGDILNPLKFKSNVLSQQWPHKTMVYKIGFGFSTEEQRLIFDAMNEIQSKTCIKFRQASYFWDRDYVIYTKVATGCSAHVGKTGGQQFINLEPGCFNGGHTITMHETIHALGIGHEHNRPDRDNFVIIYYDRIMPEHRYAFEKDDSNTFGVPYDYSSIMHYRKDAFAIRPWETTIAPKTMGTVMGESTHLSNGDTEKLKRMYRC